MDQGIDFFLLMVLVVEKIRVECGNEKNNGSK